MFKVCHALAAVAVAFAASNGAAQADRAEIGYERGTLGFEALMANDNEAALRQLLSERSSVSRNDPARLINLGRAYARLGDTARARQSFEAAANCKEDFDLVLSDGTVMNSRKVASLALKQLERR
jgi:Flp pilus assembly protein TadD